MSEELAVWPTLFLLGAYHGINPGMGWLFAVARGMQERRARAVAWSLPPIALGHALAIGVVVLIVQLAQVALPMRYIRIGVAVRHKNRLLFVEFCARFRLLFDL